ncbi:MAG: hypothetical protein HY788_08610, partial [Deltaproteobacteria bacterium]|nr:hypothetical protein [Deltaproteobacteria bacterium]
KKQTHLNMTLFPLLAPDNGEPDYLTLDEAIEREQIEVTEVSESGSVPDLKLINRGKQEVLIIEGEELQGAKQNRNVNSTFLIDGNCELMIPVKDSYCTASKRSIGWPFVKFEIYSRRTERLE